jgi:hypothetical protein
MIQFNSIFDFVKVLLLKLLLFDFIRKTAQIHTKHGIGFRYSFKLLN